MIPVKNCSWSEVKKKCFKEKKMLDYRLITTALWFPLHTVLLIFTHILLISVLQRIRKK